MGWKSKWRRARRSITKRIKPAARITTAIATGGLSEVGRNSSISKKTVGAVESGITKTGKAAVKATDQAVEATDRMGRSIKKFANDPNRLTAAALTMGMSETLRGGTDVAMRSVPKAMSLMSKQKNVMEEDLGEAPPELQESAADRAERERREFLQKKRGSEKGGRGSGRTILTQRSGQTPSLLGGF